MKIVMVFAAVIFAAWAGAGLIHAWHDYKFRKPLGKIDGEQWRRVPNPNWRSSRGGQYW